MIPLLNLLTQDSFDTITPARYSQLAHAIQLYKEGRLQTLPPEIDKAVFDVAVLGFRGKNYYARYLKSAHWQRYRARRIKQARNRCQDCGGFRRKLQLHHVSYRRLGHEHDDDVLVLCGRCHQKRHGRL